MWFTVYPFENIPVHLTCLLGPDGNLYIEAKDVGEYLCGYNGNYLNRIVKKFDRVHHIPKLPEKCFTRRKRQTRVVTVDQMKEWILAKPYRSWWMTVGGFFNPEIDGEEIIRRLDFFWSSAHVTIEEDEILTNGEFFPHYLLFESRPVEVGSRPIGPWWADAWNEAMQFYARYEKPKKIQRLDTVTGGGEGPNDDRRSSVVINDVVKMYDSQTGKWKYYTQCGVPSDEELLKTYMEEANLEPMMVVPAAVYNTTV